MNKILFALALIAFTELKAQQPEPYAPELFDLNISSGLCGFSPDGKTIYFVREDVVKKKLFIYQARKSGRKWKDAKLMPFSGVNSDLGGRLSADGNTFYFTSDRPNGSDKPDDEWNIWMVEKRGEGWGEPVALKEINSKGMECCPLPIDKNKIMFSADRDREHAWWISIYDLNTKSEVFLDSLNGTRFWQWPSSFAENDVLLLNSMMRKDSKGMDDIYVSFFKNGKWTVPQNVGGTVNTKVYEDSAMLTPDKKWLIYSQHETHETPSRLMMVPWKPLYERLRK